MGDSLSKFVAIIIAVLILFIFPIKHEFERQDDTSRMFVLTETTRLVDSVRNLGYLNTKMYTEYTKRLAATGNIYDIELEHYHKVYDPIADPNATPTPTPTDSPSKSNFKVGYEGTFTDKILEKLYPNDDNADTTYIMSKGDYFAIRIKNKNKTTATRLQEMFYGRGLPVERILVEYGGMIKNEDY